MAFEIEKMANKLGGNGNGFEMERISEAVENGAGGSSGSDSGGVLVVNAVNNDGVLTLDKTWKQIHDADVAVIIDNTILDFKGTSLVVGATIEEGEYTVQDHKAQFYVATSENGYPVGESGPK